jgi:thiamine pyrophosphate-dependent acetolactate synthase large subunit-like protein
MTQPIDPPVLHRRGFFQVAAGGAGLAVAAVSGAGAAAPGVPSETGANIVTQPSPAFGQDLNTADIIVETLIAWGATHVFGVVGDGINSIIEALRKRQDSIRYVGVRHEEAAAFMASGFAKHTGRLGVCIGTTGPGAIHLMNGLYDAFLDGAPVVAITGITFHDLIGTRYQQDVDTVRLLQEVALYNVQVTGPEHAVAVAVANRACRTALGDRGVAHLTVAKDVQMMKLAANKRSMGNPGIRTSSSWSPPIVQPGQARGVQVDLKSDRIRPRYPIEVGLTGDVKATLRGLLPLLTRQSNRGFLQDARSRMRNWNQLLEAVENTPRSPLRPQMVVKAVSDLIADDAVISLDCGANTHFSARHLQLRANQRLTEISSRSRTWRT